MSTTSRQSFFGRRRIGAERSYDNSTRGHIMPVIDILISEHVIIEQVLTCLEKLADRCDTAGKLDTKEAGQIVDFLRHFADGRHHRKEEEGLFPLLEKRGLSVDGPTGVMRADHGHPRRYLAGLGAAVEGAESGEPDSNQAFARIARPHAAGSIGN
jgi:hemerythrin-like domain-containing protein